jgi:hypothetical protein
MRTKRRFPLVVLPIAAVFVAGALSWSAFAVPMLVKYPTDLDVTPRYRGTFTLFVDPTTTAVLTQPRHVPLDIKRHIRSINDESSASRVVVEETISQRAGDVFAATQKNVYVMDRRTLENVADERAYAFDPSNVVDRSGAYRLNLPFDTSPDSIYKIYKNEIGTTYETREDTAAPTSDEAGLRLHNFRASATEVPLDDAYLAELNQIVALPESLTLDQLKPQLEAAGLDVDAVLFALAPAITADDLAVLSQIAARPIPLQYVLSVDGTARVETTTGAEVDVAATEAVGAKPAPTDMAQLQALFARYPDVPEALAAGEALAALSAAPATKLFEYRYEQTPASVANIADEVRSQRQKIRLAELYVPTGLSAAAVLITAVGGLMFWLRRASTIDPRHAPHFARPETERESVSSGKPR